MTDDELIKLAREADPYRDYGKLFEMANVTPDTLHRFAELVAAEEREACAKVCDSRIFALDNAGNPYRREATASQCASAIRARKAD